MLTASIHDSERVLNILTDYFMIAVAAEINL
ncbi:hypothetical protein SAMN05421855_102627 [Ulvibacter litoralis]|uniref:Uncharacterized protein n=1 Tax=Ulvibacter litoralis TaxID=227084 RepID=A0A1G7FLC6_9FLAO|nr:hypothetical protein SAMN05421855_102627 [Ulvibacter litoralis]